VKTVAILGGGFCGTMAAVNLARLAKALALHMFSRCLSRYDVVATDPRKYGTPHDLILQARRVRVPRVGVCKTRAQCNRFRCHREGKRREAPDAV